MATCGLNSDCRASVISGSPSALDLGPMNSVMVESPQAASGLPLDPLLDLRIVRSENVNAQGLAQEGREAPGDRRLQSIVIV